MTRVHITSVTDAPAGPIDARCTCGWGILRLGWYTARIAAQGHRFDVMEAGEAAVAS